MFWCSQSCNGCCVLGSTPGSAAAKGGLRCPRLVPLRASALYYYRAAPKRGFLPVEATEAFHAETWREFIAPGQLPELGERPVTPGTASLTANEMLLDGVLS